MNVEGISFSSDKKLARCEMMYHYRYDEKLKRIVKSEGLLRGDWCHRLLEARYRNPSAPVTPKRRIRSGETRVGWQAKFDEIMKKEWNKMFDEEKEFYGLDFPDHIFDLLTHYDEYWSPVEQEWEILGVEEEFSLVSKLLGVPIRWKIDLRVKEDGRMILVETKAKKEIPGVDERILQPQIHSYAYLLSKKDIKIDGLLWNYIRTKPVPRPKINKDGSLSIRQINTDQRGYLKSLQEAGIHPQNNSEREAIEEKLKSLPETLALERIPNSVRLKMGEQFVKDWVERARRAREIPRPLRNWSRNCKWDCDYYDLCQADMRGDTDRNLIIKKDFIINIKVKEELK